MLRRCGRRRRWRRRWWRRRRRRWRRQRGKRPDCSGRRADAVLRDDLPEIRRASLQIERRVGHVRRRPWPCVGGLVVPTRTSNDVAPAAVHVASLTKRVRTMFGAGAGDEGAAGGGMTTGSAPLGQALSKVDVLSCVTSWLETMSAASGLAPNVSVVVPTCAHVVPFVDDVAGDGGAGACELQPDGRRLRAARQPARGAAGRLAASMNSIDQWARRRSLTCVAPGRDRIAQHDAGLCVAARVLEARDARDDLHVAGRDTKDCAKRIRWSPDVSNT